MTSVALAAIAGLVVGWGIAADTLWVAGAAGAAGLVGIFLDRARLADHHAAPSTSVTTSQAGWEDFHRELARARRHERPVAIVRLPGAAADAPERASAIVPFVRRIDRVWAEHGDVNIVLPETDRAAAERLIDRIRARRPEAVGDAPAIATFPVDGLTSGAIVSALYGIPLPTVAVPAGIGRPVELPADVIELRPRLSPDAPLTDRRESSS
jgi:hypothetical protein